MSLTYRSDHPMCERCGEKPSEHVHHRLSPFDYGISWAESNMRMYDNNNLMAVCAECHNAIHEEQEKKKREARKNRDQTWYIRY